MQGHEYFGAKESPFVRNMVFCPNHERTSNVVDVNLCPSCYAPGSNKARLAMIRGIVQAALEMAVLRHDLCFEDQPPMAVEQCAEMVQDVFDALRGIGTPCDPRPCKEFLALDQALSVGSGK